MVSEQRCREGEKGGMRFMRSIHTQGVIRLAAAIACVLAASNARAVDQGWMVNSLALNASDRITIAVSQENRFKTFSYWDDHYLSNYQLTVAYKFDHDFYALCGYRRQDEEKTSSTTHENRYFIEGGWKTRLQGNVQFDWRLMVESRNYEQELLEDFARYRARIRLTYKTRIGPVKCAPFMGSEIFCDDRETSPTFLNRHRLYLGSDFPLHKHVSFNAYYMRQDEKGRTPMSALIAGFQLKV